MTLKIKFMMSIQSPSHCSEILAEEGTVIREGGNDRSGGG